jgi:hypothetical protein
MSAGPFLHTGRSAMSSGWMADTGIEVRLEILHAVGFGFSYGRSLTDDKHALFLRPGP